MKIKIVINGKEILYIDLNSLLLIFHQEFISVPTFIMNCIPKIVNDDNRFNFLEFTEPEEIAFLEKECGWLLDYKEYIGKTKAELIDELDELDKQLEEICTMNQKECDEQLFKKFFCLEFRIKYIQTIGGIQNGKYFIQLPEQIGEEQKNRNKLKDTTD